ncbi:MAG: SUMF1/EgtB/PvdO family nonheme iron enzyme [Spirochaetia bacterium]
MKNKKMNGAEEERVKLKPVLGVEPGIYLTIIYSILILAVIFFLVIFPGMRNHGSVLIINSQPAGASVIVDGVRVGSTPYRGFVSSGSHQLTVSKHFFESSEQNITVKGRVPGSLLFPRKRRVFIQLDLTDPEAYVRYSFKEFSSWAMTGESTFRYPVPLVLTDTAADFVGAGAGGSPFLELLIQESVQNITSKWLFADLVEGSAIAAGDSLILTGNGLAELVQKFIHVHKDYTIPSAVSSYLESELEAMDKLEKALALNDQAQEEPEVFPENSRTRMAITVGEKFNFSLVPGGNLKSGERGRSFPDFYMLETEITREQYMMFLRENPQWQRDNIPELIAGGFVTNDYLSDFQEWEKQQNIPAAFISRYAAEAFCSWLNRKYGNELSGFSVRLPDEWEWEYAALLNGAVESPEEAALSPVTEYSAGELSLSGMSGGVWEWCGNWYFPTPPLNEKMKTVLPGVAASVRGGSWANNGEVKPTARGNQPPFWCTPFLGFRPVLILKK